MTTNKKTMAWLGLAALALGAVTAQADPNASNNTGAFTVRITPNVDLGVTVDTSGSAWAGSADLDVTTALGAESLLGTGVKLTVAGDFSNQEFRLSAAALDTWALDTDETPGADSMRLYGMIGADQGAAPATGLFSGAGNLITTSVTSAGQAPGDESGNANHVYEFLTGQSPQYANVDGMAVTTARRLWLRANTPTTTTSDAQQRFTVTVTAMSGAGN